MNGDCLSPCTPAEVAVVYSNVYKEKRSFKVSIKEIHLS